MYSFDVYPKNKEHFLKLMSFGRECLEICKEANINPVLHGSVAYLFYTRDSDNDVNDLDFMIPESSMSILTQKFTEEGIANELSHHPSLKAIRNGLKASFHSIEFFLNGLSSITIPVLIEGRNFDIINPVSLMRQYEVCRDSEADRREVCSKKIEKLSLVNVNNYVNA